MDFQPQVDLLATEESGANLLHKLAESGSYKGWRFLLSCLTPKEREKLLTAENNVNDNCITLACKHQKTLGHVKIIQSILSEKFMELCDFNGGGEGQLTPARPLFALCRMARASG